MLEKIRAQKTLITVLCLVITLAITVVAGMDFYQFRNYQEVITSEKQSRKKMQKVVK